MNFIDMSRKVHSATAKQENEMNEQSLSQAISLASVIPTTGKSTISYKKVKLTFSFWWWQYFHAKLQRSDQIRIG